MGSFLLSSPSVLPTCSDYCPGTLMKLHHLSFRLLKAPAATLMASQSAPHCFPVALSCLNKQLVISHQAADWMCLCVNCVYCSHTNISVCLSTCLFTLYLFIVIGRSAIGLPHCASPPFIPVLILYSDFQGLATGRCMSLSQLSCSVTLQGVQIRDSLFPHICLH